MNREAVAVAATKATWRVLDAAVAAKELLPERYYKSPGAAFGHVLLLPGLLLVSFLAAGLVVLGWYSVLTYDPMEFIVYEYTAANWVEFATTPTYHEVLARTFGLAALVTVVAVAAALPYAYLTVRTRSPLARKLLLAGVFVPFFTGVIIRAYGWLILLGKNGAVNFLFGLAGVGPVQIIGTELAVVVGLLQIMIPYAILMEVPALEAIDRSLERAAQSLGANRRATARHVVLPLAVPGISAAAVVVFTLSVAVFSIPAFLGAGKVDFVANFIHSTMFTSANFPLGATLSLALVAVASVVVLAIFYRFEPGTIRVGSGGEP